MKKFGVLILRTKSLVFVLTLALAAVSQAQVATFDDFTEGDSATVLNDGGITFLNLDYEAADYGSFFIDDGSGLFDPQSGYSSPNIMTFNAYSPDPGGVGFGRLKSFDFTAGVTASSASMSVFSTYNDPGDTVTLEGLRNGLVVGSTTISIITDTLGVQNLKLDDGVYDSFHLVGNGPNDFVYIGVDNVTITPVPEPATLAPICLGAFGLLLRRTRRS